MLAAPSDRMMFRKCSHLSQLDFFSDAKKHRKPRFSQMSEQKTWSCFYVSTLKDFESWKCETRMKSEETRVLYISAFSSCSSCFSGVYLVPSVPAERRLKQFNHPEQKHTETNSWSSSQWQQHDHVWRMFRTQKPLFIKLIFWGNTHIHFLTESYLSSWLA